MRLVAIALAIGGVLAACAPAPAPPAAAPAGSAASAPKDVIKLRIGTATTPPAALPESTLWLARDLGCYQQEGLDVEITEVQATPSVIAAMRAGEVDVGQTQL